MKIVAKIVVLCVGILFLGCNSDEDLKEGTLALNFTLSYGDQPMKMYQNYIYPNPEVAIQFSRVSFFLNTLSVRDATKSTQVQDIDYINLTNAYIDPVQGKGQIFEIKKVPTGTYNGMTFNIGLPAALNDKSPIDFGADHVLSSNAEYWTSWESYIFFKCEGLIADQTDPTPSIPLALHLGANFALLPVTLDKPFEIVGGKTTTVNINIDLKRFFGDNKIYDIYSNPQLHSLSQQPYIEELVKNLGASIQ